MISISAPEMQRLVQDVYDYSGIHLESGKEYLVENRLDPMLRELRCESFSEFLVRIHDDPSGMLKEKMIDFITTGETSFFRDQAPFNLLKTELIPELILQRRRKGRRGKIALRFWSAACSTGQEAYSLAILLRELLGNDDWSDLCLLGTDISNHALDKAKQGIYSNVDVERGLTLEQRNYFFEMAGSSRWKLKEEVRAMVSFQKLNLMEDFSQLGKFDVILCRNVGVYFREKDRQNIFTRLGHCLARDGYLMVGATESLQTLCPQYASKRHLNAVYYQLNKKENGA